MHEFRPGFRCSVFDGLLLGAGALCSWLVWLQSQHLGFVIAFVVGHFFLFCNVFRISRTLELIWAVAFLVFAHFATVSGRFSWTIAILLSLLVTLLVIGIAMKKPSYHGVGWRHVNPDLPEWWKASSGG